MALTIWMVTTALVVALLQIWSIQVAKKYILKPQPNK